MKMNFVRLGQFGIFRSIFTEKKDIAIVFKILAWKRRRNTSLYWLMQGFNNKVRRKETFTWSDLKSILMKLTSLKTSNFPLVEVALVAPAIVCSEAIK